MFKKVCFFALCPFFVLVLSACSGTSSVDGGLSPVETIVLDDEYNAALSVDKDQVFALDMLRPAAKGYRITGAAFDPAMLRMERYLEYDDGEPRARYLFTALQEGVSDVLIRMVPVAGGDVTTYRQVTVTVGSGGGWFG
ncbi:hypothetical protein BerOc1_00330 [Pseudodesulfovibrio hydrargyri]|uniref:PrcB C-terminal domain-containing protein n=1 Tax=Pseudodesulfovibrio hydrargyri TaxID=2125990 RepID=A0A1J5N0R7_9BACT|nr:hypothetical protein BerOc1_00330 [Pseudodesulfovibrio hydrargyri]